MAKAEVNGFSVHYAEHGDGASVVFVHGGFASFARTLLDSEEHDWSGWEDDFAQRFRFITYDRRSGSLARAALAKPQSMPDSHRLLTCAS